MSAHLHLQDTGTVATAAAPAAANAPDLSAEIAALADLDLHGLRLRWRRLFRKPTPPHLPRYLLLRIIAYRIQANAYGDLDRETIRFLDRIAREREMRRAGGEAMRTKAPPPIPPVSEKRSLKSGTILVREHEGVLHRVTVVTGGFAWNEITYRSLSEIARAITGTNWNGPRFFGLRDKTKPARSTPAPEHPTP
jgi:Protein of unknown function (DUF2924)